MVKDGKLIHVSWEHGKAIIEAADVIYMLGNDAVACDKVSLCESKRRHDGCLLVQRL